VQTSATASNSTSGSRAADLQEQLVKRPSWAERAAAAAAASPEATKTAVSSAIRPT
jgi:hypothetical protein